MTRSTHPSLSDAFAGVWAQVARSILSLVRALKHRHEIRHLAEFDDRMLKDIGLLRSDVEGALAEPLLRNPSWVLVRCAERHTRAERMVPQIRKSRPQVPLVSPLARSA